MNIGIFSDNYYPQISGVSTLVDVMYKELTDLGHNVYIFTNKYPSHINSDKNIFRLPSIPFVFDNSCRVGAFYSFKIMNEIKKLNLDIIHTQTEFSIGFFGRIVAKKLKIPLIHTYHTMYEDWIDFSIGKNILGNISKFIIKKITKSHCNQSSFVIAPSLKVKKLLNNYGLKNKIEIIPGGIDIDLFLKTNKEYDFEKISNFKNGFGIKNNDKVLLNIGRQSKEKNVESIIFSLKEILKFNNNVKLVIIGDGPNKGSIEKLSKQIGVSDNIIFLGKVPRSEIERYYKMADFFITASKFETQGLTVIEAMAANVPVVVKNDDAFYGIVDNNFTGFVFNEDKDLPDLIIKLINNENIVKNVVLNSNNNISKFSSKEFAKNIENLYLKLLNNI